MAGYYQLIFELERVGLLGRLRKNLDLSSSIFSEGISYAPKSVSGAQDVVGGNVVLKEYRHKKSNRYFYTSRTQDQSSLDTTYAGLFEVTGNTITVKAAIDAGLSPVYRLFNKGGFHLYTAEINDRTSYLTDSKFQDEGIEGYAIKINSNATCPTSPSVTYPVYRLSHSGSYKYRLVTDSALKAQLLTQGYFDEGVLFCATAVSSTLVAGSQDCNFNGVNVAHGASVTAYQSASVPANQSCVSEQRQCRNTALVTGSFTYSSCTVQSPVGPGGGGTCSWIWADDFFSTAPANRPRPNTACTSANDGQKQNGVAGAADWTCSCSVTPVVAGTASCTFGNTTLAHGATATGYSLATGSCTSQSVTCTNGNLSNPSFNLNSCPSAATIEPVAADGCPGRAPNAEISVSKGYQRFVTGGWSYMTFPMIPYIYADMSPVGAQYIIKLVVTSADTTLGLAESRLPFFAQVVQGQSSARMINISNSKCDYGSLSTTGRSQGGGGAIGGTTDSISVNDPRPGMLNLTTGVWYINIKSTTPGGQTAMDWHGAYLN